MAAEDDLRPRRLGDVEERVEVDGPLAIRERLVADEVENLPHVGDGRAVREVAPVREIHSEDDVARLEERQVRRLFIGDPESGCTFACSARKSAQARRRASSSTASVYCWPP